MKTIAPLIAAFLTVSLTAAEVPKVFEGLMQAGIPIRAQRGMVVPPAEIDKFVAKVETSARKDPKWFREYAAASKQGVPLPYDERLGLTKEEYNEYIALWNKREFKPMEEVMLMLRESPPGKWKISSTGSASSLTTLYYHEKTDEFHSPNGILKRIDDIKADPASILGEWTGSEWKVESDTGFGKIKENVALGRFADNKHGLVVYRAQELTTEGARLLDNTLVIRFPLAAAANDTKPAAAKDTKPVPAKETKPVPVKVKPKKKP
jgi:hypothetical protein